MPGVEIPAIETFGLSKRYGRSRVYAVHDLDLTVMPGEVYGFLGPNGAGKSTTIKLLMNFIWPSEGQVHVLGLNGTTQSTEIRTKVGYLSGEAELYPKMTGLQFLEYMMELQRPKRKNYARELARTFEAILSQPIGSLSKGNRQKIAIIQAFMHEPDLLILDEPTSGLDPLMQEAFFEVVRSTRGRGASLFISSHNLTEVQKMCDRTGFIRDGELVAEQKIADLGNTAVQIYDIAFGEAVPVSELRSMAKAKVRSNTDRHATISVRGDLKPLFMVLAKHKVLSIDRQEADLEGEFLRWYRKSGK